MNNWQESSFADDKEGMRLVSTKTNLMLDFGIYRKIGTRNYSLFFTCFRAKEIQLLKAESLWNKKFVEDYIQPFCDGFRECLKISTLK